jgi:GAF domain
MDYYSILDHTSSQAGPEPAPPSCVPANLHSKAEAAPVAREALRFPGEDGGKSLGEMAQRDLDATLQLLAERAQYITGASGAAIALREGESMVCCASAGPSAPELGAHLQTDSGLSAESVRTRQILRCEDAENDPRVNRESCRTFGVASVVVMPLVRGEEVYGVFELLSGRPRAFEERDLVALNRLAEMIQTAVEHAEAARRAETELGMPGITPSVMAETSPPEHAPGARNDILQPDFAAPSPKAGAETDVGTKVAAAPDQAPDAIAALAGTPELAASAHQDPAASDPSSPISTIAFGNLRRCETCGFPVSEGRRLCLDCEAATPGAVASVGSAAEFFGDLDDSNPGWVRSHLYLIATAVIAVATIALLIWRL